MNEEELTKKLEKTNILNFRGGMTFFERYYDKVGKLAGFKVGNDYNHIWNGSETFESIEQDLQKTIDQFKSKLEGEIV